MRRRSRWALAGLAAAFLWAGGGLLAVSQEGGGFGRLGKHRISRQTDPVYQSEVGLMEAEDGSLTYNTNHPATPTDNDTDIYQDGRRLPFNTEADENDPCFIGGEILNPAGSCDLDIAYTERLRGKDALPSGKPARRP